jgi:hypothetical protein
LLEELAAGDAEMLHQTVVEAGEQLADRRVQFGDAEEAPMPERREDPALRHEHTDLDERFVPGMATASGHDRGAVVLGELQVGAIDDGLVAAGLGDATPQIVGDEEGGRAAEELHHAHVGGDPRGQILGRTGFGVHVAARPEYADKHLDGNDLAGAGIDDLGTLAREVHEGLLPGPVDLAHGRLQGADPALVVPAELAVAIPVGVLGEVLQVQPQQGHARPLEFLMQPRHVGQRPRHAHDVADPSEQPSFELRVVPLGRQWPRHASLLGAVAVRPDRAHAHPTGPGNRPVGQVLLILQPKNLTDLSHQ